MWVEADAGADRRRGRRRTGARHREDGHQPARAGRARVHRELHGRRRRAGPGVGTAPRRDALDLGRQQGYAGMQFNAVAESNRSAVAAVPAGGLRGGRHRAGRVPSPDPRPGRPARDVPGVLTGRQPRAVLVAERGGEAQTIRSRGGVAAALELMVTNGIGRLADAYRIDRAAASRCRSESSTTSAPSVSTNWGAAGRGPGCRALRRERGSRRLRPDRVKKATDRDQQASRARRERDRLDAVAAGGPGQHDSAGRTEGVVRAPEADVTRPSR